MSTQRDLPTFDTRIPIGPATPVPNKPYEGIPGAVADINFFVSEIENMTNMLLQFLDIESVPKAPEQAHNADCLLSDLTNAAFRLKAIREKLLIACKLCRMDV